MITEYRLKVLFLLFILLITFLGTLGTLVSIPVFVMLVLTTSVFFTTFFGSVWAPTPKKIMKIVARESKMRKGQHVYDLGSGDGRVAIYLAKNTPANITGVEIDYLKWILSTIKIKLNCVRNAKIIRKNFFDADIRDADFVYFYLTQRAVDRLQPKLKRLKRGAIVVSYVFRCKHLRLIKELKKERVYIYRV